MRAAAIPASEISKAMAGGGSCRIDLSLSSMRPTLPRGDAETRSKTRRNSKVSSPRFSLRLHVSAVNGNFLPFNERHLVNFPERGNSQAHFLHGRFAQEGHPVFFGRPFDLRRGALVQNHFADAVGQIQQLVNGGAPPETGAAALEAAGAFHQR